MTGAKEQWVFLWCRIIISLICLRFFEFACIMNGEQMSG